MGELLYKDITFKINGAAFRVYNNLGYGYREKVYQRGLIEEFKTEKLKFCKECPVAIKYNGKIIAKYYIDFVVENKIVVELKIDNDFYVRDIKQILSYLKAINLRLGLLIIYNKKGVKIRRIIN
ncbi:MAG: GxxExxY protein [Candidatus Parcubacteria bacterium]|nr:GxxExxY protein [Candidatus Parcubacteria bacterium]